MIGVLDPKDFPNYQSATISIQKGNIFISIDGRIIQMIHPMFEIEGESDNVPESSFKKRVFQNE